jgi:hypothetical protein
MSLLRFLKSNEIFKQIFKQIFCRHHDILHTTFYGRKIFIIDEDTDTHLVKKVYKCTKCSRTKESIKEVFK